MITITAFILIGAGFGAAAYHGIPKCIKPKPIQLIAGTLMFALVTNVVQRFSDSPSAWYFGLGTVCYIAGASITHYALKKKREREQALWIQAMRDRSL